MHTIPLPQTIKLIKKNKNQGTLVITPCFQGYATTLGNALRRVMLSSLEGGAVTSVKIKNVKHEFSTLPYVKEDVINIILNLKLLRFKIFTDKPVKISLRAKGEEIITAKNIKTKSDVKIANLDQHIATLTDKKAELEIDFVVQKSRGYLPVEAREDEKKEIGEIKIDAMFSPIEKINYKIKNVRVGKKTNFEKLLLGIKTDGTIGVKEAVEEASRILIDHFAVLGNIDEQEKEKIIKKAQEKEDEVKIKKEKNEKIEEQAKKDIKKQSLEELKFSMRTLSALKKSKIKTLAGITRYTEEKFLALDGIGAGVLKEVKKILKKYGLAFK